MSGSPNELIERYLSGTKLLLDIHAPLIQRDIIPRQNAPWYTEDIHDSKRLLERKWKNSKLEVDKMLYRNQCDVLAKKLSDRKATNYSTKVRECAGNPKLWNKLTDEFIVNQYLQQLLIYIYAYP